MVNSHKQMACYSVAVLATQMLKVKGRCVDREAMEVRTHVAWRGLFAGAFLETWGEKESKRSK